MVAAGLLLYASGAFLQDNLWETKDHMTAQELACIWLIVVIMATFSNMPPPLGPLALLISVCVGFFVAIVIFMNQYAAAADETPRCTDRRSRRLRFGQSRGAPIDWRKVLDRGRCWSLPRTDVALLP